jgi:hypothetical protein
MMSREIASASGSSPADGRGTWDFSEGRSGVTTQVEIAIAQQQLFTPSFNALLSQFFSIFNSATPGS